MAKTRKASIEVEANVAQAVKAMSRLSSKIEDAGSKVDNLGGQLGQLGSLMKGVATGAIGGAFVSAVSGAVSAAVDLAHETKKVEGVFRTLPFSIGPAAAATGGFVNNMELAQAAAKAAAMGVSENSDQFSDLAEIAAKAATALGTDVGKSVDDLTTALARQSPQILDNLGVTLKISDANKMWAEQNGVAVSAMTDAQKKSAFQAAALQMLAQKYSNVKVEAKGAADRIIQAEVAAENAKIAMMASQTPAQSLASAFQELGDEVLTMNIQSRQHGADLVRLERVLAKHGTTIEELGGIELVAAKIANQRLDVIQAQEQAARDAAAAEEARAIAIEHARAVEQASAYSEQLELDIELMQIAGEDAFTLAAYKLDLAHANLEVAQAQAIANGEDEKSIALLKQAQREVTLAEARLEAAANKPRGGGGRGKSKKDREAERQRELDEMIQAAIEREAAIAEWNKRELDAKVAAKLEFEQWEADEDAARLERIREQAEREAEIQEELQRKREEIAKREAALALARRESVVEMSSIVVDAASSQVSGLAAAMIAGEELSKKQIKMEARIQSANLAIQAATHTAKGIAYAIALSPKAPLEFAAAAKAAAGSAAVLAMGELGAALAGGGGGGGGSGNQFADSGAFAGTGAGGSTPRNEMQDAPVSPLEGDGTMPAGGASGGGGPVVVNVAGSVLSQGDLARALRDALRDGVKV